MLGGILSILAACVPSARPSTLPRSPSGGLSCRASPPRTSALPRQQSPYRAAACAARCDSKSPRHSFQPATATARTASGAPAPAPRPTDACRRRVSGCWRASSSCARSSPRRAFPSCSARPAARRCSAATRSRIGRSQYDWGRSTAIRAYDRNTGSSSTRPRPGSLFPTTGSRAIPAREASERGSLAQPLQRQRLAAALAPAVEHALEQLAIFDQRQHLDAPATLGRRPQAHQIQLARVADPRRAVQRPVGVLAPPQSHVELARAHAPLIGVVEARERLVALLRRVLDGKLCVGHGRHQLSRGSRYWRSLLLAPKRRVTRL